jgi:hypothetical protein
VDIGGDVGALIVYMAADHAGSELHLGRVGHSGHGPHTGVWPRQVAGRQRVAAVFPSLSAGRYHILDDDGAPMDAVVIEGARVAEIDLVRAQSATATRS